MTMQLFVASLRSSPFASVMPLKRFRRIKLRCRRKFGLSPLLLLLCALLPVLLLLAVVVEPPAAEEAAPLKEWPFLEPADESAATSMTSFTLRWESLEEVSVYTSALMCLAVLRPCKDQNKIKK